MIGEEAEDCLLLEIVYIGTFGDGGDARELRRLGEFGVSGVGESWGSGDMMQVFWRKAVTTL